VNERSHVGPLLPPVAELHGSGAVDEPAQELVVHASLQDQAAGGGAPLAGGAERAPEHAVERQI
jgi:hypothetical protein